MSHTNSPKQYSVLIKVAIGLVDVLLMAIAFFIAYWLRFDQIKWQGMGQYLWLFYASVPIALFFLQRSNVLTGFRYQTLKLILYNTVSSFLFSAIVFSAILFLSHATYYSRLLVGYSFGLAALLVVLEKTLIKVVYDAYLRKGGMNIKVALVGWGDKLDRIKEQIRKNPSWGISVVVQLDTREISLDQVAEVIKDNIVDEVYLALPRDDQYHRYVDGFLRRIEHYALPIKITLNFDDLCHYYAQQPCKMADYDGLLLAPYNLDPDQLIVKRIMDIVGAVVGLCIAVLMFVPMAIAIKLDSPGSIFFSQIRVGKGGRRFRLYKFRSMCSGAESQRQELAHLNIHEGPIFKVNDDPRITRLGKFIRQYSLDEFPQFWNVLKGEMSLVGTRPPTVDEVDKYEGRYFQRISMKPGITGLWQVSGRNKISDFDQIFDLDLAYIKSWNPWQDIRILFKTLFVAFNPLRGKGM
ncbi:MAG: sugar transferase [Desulfobulbaceae bacterium]|nr:sugar transferase [Desulfobulbaceae bacterium]